MQPTASSPIAQSTRRQISIGVKIFGIAASMLGLLVVVVYVSSNRLRRVSEEIGALADYIVPLTNTVAAVDVHALEQEVLFERILKHHGVDPVDRGLIQTEVAEFDRRTEEVEKEFETIESLADRALVQITDEGNREELQGLLARLALVEQEVLAFQTEARAVLQALDGGGQLADPAIAEGLRRLAAEEEKFNRSIERILLDFEEFTVAAAQRGQAHQTTVQQLSISVAVLATVIGGLFAWFVSLGLVRPVRQMTRKIGDLQDGDFQVEMKVSSRDELATLAAAFNHMVGELKVKAALEETFGKYVDRRVVQRLLADATETNTAGDRQVMTVCFADVVGLEAVLEQLPPEPRVALANDYFNLMASPITERLGTLDKFIGTMVMAFWGPPFAGTQEHAQLACDAAIAQRNQFMAITERVRSHLSGSVILPPLQLCIGLATGSLVVGNIGSEVAKSYTVMGDTVNTASRLKGVSKQYGVDIVVMAATRDLLGDGFVTRELDWIQVVGKDEPVRIYELVGKTEDVAPSTLERCKSFGVGLAAYRAQDWDRAIAAFMACQDDAPAQLYCQRIEQLRDNPPPSDWDGVWQLTTK